MCKTTAIFSSFKAIIYIIMFQNSRGGEIPGPPPPLYETLTERSQGPPPLYETLTERSQGPPPSVWNPDWEIPGPPPLCMKPWLRDPRAPPSVWNPDWEIPGPPPSVWNPDCSSASVHNVYTYSATCMLLYNMCVCVWVEISPLSNANCTIT